MSDLSSHLARQLRREPRLAWLIGPGSRTFELLAAEEAQSAQATVAAAEQQLREGLTYQPWPQELIGVVEEVLASMAVSFRDRDLRVRLIAALEQAGGRAP